MKKIQKLSLVIFTLAIVLSMSVSSASAVTLTLGAGTADSDGALSLGATTATSLIIGRSGVLNSFPGKFTGILYTNDDPNTTGSLKIHSHSIPAGQGYANEFKGEFLGTGNVTTDGIAAHYRMGASGTSVMRAISAVAYLGDPEKSRNVTLSGDGTGANAGYSWLNGVLGQAIVVAGSTVNGAGVTITGTYGGLGSMAGTMTAVKYMSGIWADSQVQTGQEPVSGSSQLILATNSNTGTIGSGLKIVNEGGGAITSDITLQNGNTITNGSAGTVTINANISAGGVQSSATAVTATVGGAAIPSGSSFVSVTSDTNTKVVVLPAPTVGNVVRLAVVATGYELASTASGTVKINGGTGASASVGANVLVQCVASTSTTWICSQFAVDGTESKLEASHG